MNISSRYPVPYYVAGAAGNSSASAATLIPGRPVAGVDTTTPERPRSAAVNPDARTQPQLDAATARARLDQVRGRLADDSSHAGIRRALSEYEAVGEYAQRREVSAVLGIDVYV